MVDVTTRTVIECSRSQVAAFAADPDNTTRWYRNISSVEWLTPRPLTVGTRLAFVARFLGRRLSYVYEVVEHVPGTRLRMRTTDGPFPMETTYGWTDAPGGTEMTLQNRGKPAAFATILTPFMSFAMRAATRKDLARLKHVLELE